LAALLERVQLARHQAQSGNREFLAGIGRLLEDVETQLAGGPDLVKQAWATMSYSERECVRMVAANLEGDTGMLVASKLADAQEFTRSTLVNGLRKMESAGAIVTHSLGMKGTRIQGLVPNWRRRILDLAV
jgi:transcriptional pleiotropic repressor